MKNIDFEKVLSKFNIKSRVSEYGDGHINGTFIAETQNYIVQRVNTDIFTDPVGLMKNIENVTSFLREKIKAAGGDPSRETLTLIKTLDGESFYRDEGGNVFRVYEFIRGSRSVSCIKDPSDMYRVGQGFGKFQYMLREYPAETLFETIKNFHNTPSRIEDFKRAVAEDRAGRVSEVREEIETSLSYASLGNIVTDGLSDGSIPLRVTHNDTKINNILFDADSGEVLAVIDLDTVMSGSALYDIGDSFRTGCATAAEDETDFDLVHFDEEAFGYYVKGYFEEMREELTEREIELIPFSAKLMTYESCIRFLGDYLNGDVYFRISRERHNLDRARNQLALLKDIEKKEEKLREIVNRLK